MTEIPKGLFDFGVHHQIDLQRYSNGVVRDIIALLNDADAELVEKIRKRGEKGPWTNARLKALLEEIKQLTDESYWKAEKKLAKEMKQYAKHESEVTAEVIASQFPTTFSTVQPTAAQLAAIVDKAPITVGPDKKLLLEEIFTALAAGKEEAIRGAIRLGMVEGETIDQMVRRLVGTRAARYEDGVIARDRRGAAAMVRTIVNHTSNQAVQTTYQENADLVTKWRFLATLDFKTTMLCRSYDGTEHEIGKGPIPPLHVNCRSFAVPKLKTFRELGIDIDEMPPSVRAAKGGPVKADITMDEWMKTQDGAALKGMLGASRARLFTEGKLSVKDFVSDKGTVYTLDELRARHRTTFARVFGANE